MTSVSACRFGVSTKGLFQRGVALVFLAGLVPQAPAANLPSGFTETEVASFAGSPTCMEFSPDGKLFIAQQNGIMPVWQNGSQLAANFFANAPLSTDTASERGLLGIAFDPNFASNRYVYVYYTTVGGDHHNRVSRFTADSSGNLAVAGSEFLVWKGDGHSAGNHNGGAIHFGPDGKLYIATGDNAQGSNSQSLTNQHGKILRVNADGTIPLDNPFHDSAGSNRDEIWSLGLRNPFTFTFQPGTGRMFVNDVGQNTWEEINDGGSGQSGRGLNYGWPNTEGDFNQGSNPSFTRPFYAYNHSAQQTTPSGTVITGGAFYSPTTNTFGAAYQDDYFFADLGSGWIYRIDLSTKQVTQFATGASAVDLKVTNDGSLYYLAYGVRKVFRVTSTAVTAPIITQHPQNQTVGAGSSVTFSADASGSPTFKWQRSNNNGDTWNDVPGAASKTLTFTAAQGDNNALFRAVATNANGSATSNSARLTVLVNSAPNSPTITIVSGLTADSKFIAGQVIRFSGTAADPEDGTLPASAFSWTINYLTSINQGDQDSDGLPGLTRPFSTVTNVRSGSFTPATTGPYTLADVAYAITLTVRDSQGLTTTSRRVIDPKTSSVTLASAPTGMGLTLDGQPFTAPNTFAGVVGFQRPIGAPLTQTISGTNFEFVSWSDGGDATHSISTPLENTTYTAAYMAVFPLPEPWEHTDVGAVGAAGTASYNDGTFTVKGAGYIRGRADSFHFVYLAAEGDCSITARVVDLPFDSRRDKNARAGVMIRADLSAGAPHVFIGPKAKGPMQMISRNRADRASETAGAGAAPVPYWVRVTREGGVLTAFRSADGVTWSKVRSKNTITLGSTVYIGLAVCSDQNGLLSATFDNVTATP
jgi:glucose/arabinose dehydrogenase/regulation of enolase protein 1 (concanavalin A-like superfamily)